MIQEPNSVGSFLNTDEYGQPKENAPIVSTLHVTWNATQAERIASRTSTRNSRATFTHSTHNERHLTAIWPYITADALALTMDAARIHISNYNDQVRELNSQIKKHNTSVDQIKFEKPLTKDQEVQLHFRNTFIIKNGSLKPKEYNELVDKFCAEYGPIVKKKPHQTVKYATEQFLMHFLHVYSKQLSKYSSKYMQLATNEPSKLKPFEVNAWEIASLKRNGVRSIDVCTKTIRNHRERLEECGILTDYHFQGFYRDPNGNRENSKIRGVLYHFNPDILHIFDAKTQKMTCTENQSLNSCEVKKLPDNDDTRPPLKSNIKKIENGQAGFLEKGTPSAAFSFNFYRNTPLQGVEVQQTGRAENVKISKTLSQKLKETVYHPIDFAKMLSAGAFFNHSRIGERYLREEAKNGTLTRQEMKEVIVQEFFKNASKLYRNSNVYVGCWKKAINLYMDEIFLVNNGNGKFLYSKDLMVDKLQELLWRLNNAHRWFLKTGINPLFPSDYFDFSRQMKQEIGFEYTRKAYLNHLKYIENKPKLAQSVKKKAALRNNTLTNSKKFEQILNLFFKNRRTLDEVIAYVDNNLPPQYLQQLSDRILTISNSKFTC